MQPSERYELILQQLSRQEMVTIPELMQTFDVSNETVRRDLNFLEKEKKIKKVYGGAILFNRTASITGGTLRLTENVLEKEAIGRECAAMIHEGDTLYLGPGTTVLQVAKLLKGRKNLTIITDSMYTAMEFMDTEVELYFIGGKINTRIPPCVSRKTHGKISMPPRPSSVPAASAVNTASRTTASLRPTVSARCWSSRCRCSLWRITANSGWSTATPPARWTGWTASLPAVPRRRTSCGISPHTDTASSSQRANND